MAERKDSNGGSYQAPDSATSIPSGTSILIPTANGLKQGTMVGTVGVVNS